MKRDVENYINNKLCEKEYKLREACDKEVAVVVEAEILKHTGKTKKQLDNLGISVNINTWFGGSEKSCPVAQKEIMKLKRAQDAAITKLQRSVGIAVAAYKREEMLKTSPDLKALVEKIEALLS